MGKPVEHRKKRIGATSVTQKLDDKATLQTGKLILLSWKVKEPLPPPRVDSVTVEQQHDAS